MECGHCIRKPLSEGHTVDSKDPWDQRQRQAEKGTETSAFKKGITGLYMERTFKQCLNYNSATIF